MNYLLEVDGLLDALASDINHRVDLKEGGGGARHMAEVGGTEAWSGAIFLLRWHHKMDEGSGTYIIPC